MLLPSKEAAERKGWKFQVQWVENGLPCFVRCRDRIEADAWMAKHAKYNPELIDFSAAL